MEGKELFYPEIKVELGGYVFTEGIKLQTKSSKSHPMDWARVFLNQEVAARIDLEKGQKGKILLGYGGQYVSVFEGEITNSNGAALGKNEISLSDSMLKLGKTSITQTFLNASPQEIIGYGLKQAGITRLQLSTAHLRPKPRVVIAKKNVGQLISEVQTLWSINEPYFFLGDTFYWGEKPQQTQLVHFEYGNNIIKLDRHGGFWRLDTVSCPYVTHSQHISVEHPLCMGEFEVVAVEHHTNDKGFIRTQIYF